MTNLTALQFRLMDLMAHCEMTASNGATPTEASDTMTYLWADVRARKLGLTEQQVGGIMSSLVNEKLAIIEKPSRSEPDGLFEFTQKGFEAWQAAR